MLRRFILLAGLALALALPLATLPTQDADSASGRLCATRGICRKITHACTQQVNTQVLAGQNSFTIPTGVTLLSKVSGFAAGGGAANGSFGGVAGGGGAYSEVDNLAVTPGNTLAISAGASGAGGAASTSSTSGTAGGDTSVSYLGTQILLAKGGQPGTGSGPGLGGAAASGVGTVKHSGGNGGNGGNGGGGGGGAGGPNGDGVAGSDGAPSGSIGPPFPGGNGGAGDGGFGGAGGLGSTQNNVDGSAGGAGREFGLAGAGGGGGGGVGGSAQQSNPGPSGGFGAGGAGGGFGGPTFTAGGNGGPGVVVVQFTLCGNVAPQQPQNTFFVATNGNDTNAGTLISPFLTLGQCQMAMRNSATTKTCTLRAGTYNIAAQIAFTAADSGETWQYFTADGVDTAVLDGGNALNLIFNANGANSFTINGLKFQHCVHECVGVNNSTNVLIENNEVAFTTGNDGGAAADSGISTFGITRSLIAHNYIHDMSVGCITLAAFDAGSSIDGSVIDSNVCLNAIQGQSDAGAIYTSMRATGTSGGTVSITNNYIRDWGASSATNDQVGIYLDDNMSNTTVSGNVIGPPAAGVIGTQNRNNTGAFLDNGGTNLTLQNNIIDLGNSAMVATYGGGGNSGNAAPGMPSANVTAFKSNVVISNFTGGLQTSASGVTGFAYYQGGPAASYTFGGDIYVNYAGGGSVFFNGQAKSDPSPIRPTTAALALSCPNGAYALAGNSVAFNAPTSFQPIVGGWGPPGFAIPASANHSCS